MSPVELQYTFKEALCCRCSVKSEVVQICFVKSVCKAAPKVLLCPTELKSMQAQCKPRWKCAQFLSVVLRTCSHVRSFRQHRRNLRIQGLHQFRFKKLMVFRCCSRGSAKGGRIWGMTRFINFIRTIRDAWSSFWSVCWMRKDHWLELLQAMHI